MEWQNLRSLHSLEFYKLPKLVSSLVCLPHVTPLQTLNIRCCPRSMTISEWICNLASLHSLVIDDCPQIDIIAWRDVWTYLFEIYGREIRSRIPSGTDVNLGESLITIDWTDVRLQIHYGIYINLGRWRKLNICKEVTYWILMGRETKFGKL